MVYFSIIIPNLNTPGVGKAIASLESQNFDHERYEIIVVGMDNYDLVHTSNMVKFDQSDQPLSPAQARNRGAEQAFGEILVFTDADCIASPEWLSILEERFTDPSVSVVGGGIWFSRENYWATSDNLAMFYEFLAFYPAGERQQLPSLNLAVRRKVFKEIGGFDERYPRPSGEDADLSLRLRKHGCRLVFEPRALIFHDPHRNRCIDLLRHSFYQGKYSTKIDPRYRAESELPGFINSRLGLFFFAPFLASGVFFKIFRNQEIFHDYWITAPAVYLAKLAWCMGACNHPAW